MIIVIVAESDGKRGGRRLRQHGVGDQIAVPEVAGIRRRCIFQTGKRKEHFQSPAVFSRFYRGFESLRFPCGIPALVDDVGESGRQPAAN